VTNYKVIRNAGGEVVCFGPNEDNYEPTLKAGDVLSIEATVPTPGLSESARVKLAQLTQAYSTAIQQPVSYMSTTFQADAVSVANVQATLAGLSKAGATPTGFYWVSADNTQVPFSYADIQGLAAAMLSQGWSAFAHLQAQKAIVNASSTVSAVQGVVW
jgi:hypothetical protein